jgi:hypothetical protein
VAICHAISGGLPRDVVRGVRSLLDALVQGHTLLHDVAAHPIGGDVRAELDGQQILLRRVLVIYREAHSRWLSEASVSASGVHSPSMPSEDVKDR